MKGIWNDLFFRWLSPVGVLAVVVSCLFFLYATKPLPNETELCMYHTVEKAGLMACWNDAICSLSNDEFQELYEARKNMTIHCAREMAILMLTPTKEVEPEKDVEVEEEPNNDLRAETDGA